MDRYRNRKDNPSFSSTLLDVIYRSIDERDDDQSVVYRKTMRNRQSTDGCYKVDHKQIADGVNGGGGLKNISTDVVVRRKSATGCETCSGNSYFNSSTVSSVSKYGAGISSSETETIYGFPARPRPIRTVIHGGERNTREMSRNVHDRKHQSDDLQPKVNCDVKFVKTKSRAMKIYGYLKKGKQPNSPGARLATFLISLFRTTNSKKPNIPSPNNGDHDEAIIHADRELKSAPKASSAGSFSRSCLRQSPSSSRAKLTADMKRSVRFYPATVIVNEHSYSLAHESLNGAGSNTPAVKFDRNSINEERKRHFAMKNRHIEATSMNILKNYQRKVECMLDSIKNNVTSNDDDDDDDDRSYASSDLFELDHLSAIGIDRRIQELPLYETTSVDANRAIANGLIV